MTTREVLNGMLKELVALNEERLKKAYGPSGTINNKESLTNARLTKQKD